ncbi:MAG: hypothetical protein MR897_08555 [Bacteroidales bacterium]|nr:hypothetical protein [Bacteroidales bacterium]
MESIKYLKKTAHAPFFHFLTIFFGKIPGILTIFGRNGVILARGGVIGGGVEILGEMGGGKCRFLGKSIDKGLQML